MVNRKGQALVEFVLILPVFLMILFTIVDFGVLLHTQNELENVSTDVVRMIQNGDSIEEVQKDYTDLGIQLSPYREKYQKIVLSNEVSLITPFLDRILGNPCQVKVERIIPNVE